MHRLIILICLFLLLASPPDGLFTAAEASPLEELARSHQTASK